MNVDVSLIYQIFSAVKTIFWRNDKIIYINYIGYSHIGICEILFFIIIERI